MADPGTTLFTRGQPGDADTRGESMVVKHLAKQKAAAEAEALAGLGRSVPGLSEVMLRAALEACDWDVSAAQVHLREYLASTAGGKRNDSSGSSSESDSGSRSGGRKRKRHGKDEKKSKKDKHHKKSKRAKKERKEERKEERKRPAAIGDGQFGMYGVIKETDLWEKQPEYHLWVTEVKQRNPETLQKWEERDMFKEFMEDFNTATLPHKKFYNLDRWHAKEAARSAKHGGGTEEERVSFGNLEDERRRELAVERDRSKVNAGVSLIEHMRLVGKLDGLREQQTLQKQLQLAAQIGDHEKVKQLQAKLAPDDPRKSAASQNYGFRPSR